MTTAAWTPGEITPENEPLTLLDETGAVFAQVQTDADGRFAIDGIAPGVYSLAYDLKEGTQAARLGDSTFTTEGSQLVMTEIEISENNNYTAPMLGLKIDTSIGGMVWCDNAGEIAPLSGAEVILLDEKGSELQTATTGEDGIYRFDGLMPGNYRLRVTLPNGYVVVEKDDTRLKDGQNISVMTTYTAREGESDLIVLRMSQHQLEQNIGAVQPGTLGDFCWLDLNGNGLQDAGELVWATCASSCGETTSSSRKRQPTRTVTTLSRTCIPACTRSSPSTRRKLCRRVCARIFR